MPPVSSIWMGNAHPFACRWRDADAGVIRLTMSELQRFLEGSALVGSIALSPAPFVVADAQKILACRAR